jgi:hypothetical protein
VGQPALDDEESIGDRRKGVALRGQEGRPAVGAIAPDALYALLPQRSQHGGQAPRHDDHLQPRGR